MTRFRAAGRRLTAYWQSLLTGNAAAKTFWSQLWSTPGWSVFALAYLLAAALHPPQGLPVRLCLFYLIAGHECPSCGITRSLSCLWHGNLTGAVQVHPFGPLAFAYLAACSLYLFLTLNVRLRVIHWLDTHQRALMVVTSCLVGVFLLYGATRLLLELNGTPVGTPFDLVHLWQHALAAEGQLR